MQLTLFNLFNCCCLYSNVNPPIFVAYPTTMNKTFALSGVIVFTLAFGLIKKVVAQEKAYFQQEVNYQINVSLDDVSHTLKADESIVYINNSPDELSFIWFHLWPNAYKNNQTALAKQLIADGNKNYLFATEAERGFISGLDFKINNQSIKTEPHPEHIDITKLILNEPLKPGGRITISTPFNVKIPIGIFSRLGHIEQQYQITQWYPKPAVYDNLGWHPMPYLNQGEFYSEFGSFDVSITLPKNYVLGATGTLVDGEAETAWLLENVERTKAIDKFNARDNIFPLSSTEMKTLRYQASNVHDFAWFADKRYHVLHDVVELPHSKRKVDTWVMFTNMEASLWKNSVKYVSDAVYYYSLWNGDYPYPHATAVDGALSAGGGMEYPMITVIGSSGDARGLDRVIAHEVGHNWFYGILGSNEREHAWMDEGVNSFNERRYMNTKYPPDSSKSDMGVNIAGMKINVGKLLGLPDFSETTLMDLGYRFSAVQKLDQPCDLHSGEYTQINYGTVVYGKTAIVLAYLQAYLGEELYDKCAQAYFEKWKFKHPQPVDMQKAFEEVSGKNLSWLFKEIIPTTNQVDYKIVSVKKGDHMIGPEPRSEMSPNFYSSVKIVNKGKVNSPFSISALKDDKIIWTQWLDGFSGKKTINLSLPDGEGQGGAFDKLVIDAVNSTPDINRQNNNLKMKGLCKKTEPFNLRMFGAVHNTNKTQLFWLPVAGWNKYNGFMLGTAIYNNLIPEKKFEYVLMPMYGFGNKDLAGGASAHYNLHFDKIFQTVRLGFVAERYCYGTTQLPNTNFNKLTPELFLEIKRKHLNNPIKQTIYVRSINVMQEIAVGNYSFAPVLYHYDTTSTSIQELTYKINNTRKINPYDVSLSVQQADEFVKTAITANYHLLLNKKKKAIDFRFYAGKMFGTTTNGNYYIYSSGTNGAHDYTYDQVFLGRAEASGFFSHQFAETEGNMKVYTPLGRSNDWLTALNIKSSLPAKLPIKFFADINLLPRKTALNQAMLYDAGFYIPLVKNTIEIYFPLFMSKDIKDVFYLNNADLVPPPNGDDPDKYRFKRMARMIRFTFNINKLNPFELVRNLSL